MAEVSPGSERFNNDGTVLVTRQSGFTGLISTMTIKATREQFNDWRIKGKMVQDAFPGLTADEREFLMTGVTPEEWAKAFPPEEQGEEEEEEDFD